MRVKELEDLLRQIPEYREIYFLLRVISEDETACTELVLTDFEVTDRPNDGVEFLLSMVQAEAEKLKI